jgi:Cu-Zn family superoxide dismutase
MDKLISYKIPYVLLSLPYATANIKGGTLAPGINGTVKFYPIADGTLIEAELSGLPLQVAGTASSPPIGPFGFHLHDGSTCGEGTGSDPFSAAMGHYNPGGLPHPDHAGDFPVLFSNNGYAYMVFYTDRFKPSDILHKTVILHQNPDDYRTQPAGNSGKRIACGVVKKI